MGMTLGRSRRWTLYIAVRIVAAFSLLISLILQPAAAGTVFAAVKLGDATLPRELGAIKESAEGAAGQPLIFIIGEQHVSLWVQETVADILRYLTGVYDVELVCIEGYDKPVNVAHSTDITVIRRLIASVDLAARRISGVEYFAIANPQVDVVGVEDMEAYEAYSRQLDAQQRSRREKFSQWFKDFKELDRETQSGHAINMTDKYFDMKQRLNPLITEEPAATEQLKHMQDVRDEAMVGATLRTIKEKKVDSAVLVVGYRHLDGIERILSKKKIPFVAIVAAGVEAAMGGEEDRHILQEWRQGKPTAGVEAWLSHFKPRPASARLTYQDRTAILERLAEGDSLRLLGRSQKETLDFVGTTPLPAGVQIEEVFDIEGGVGFAFSSQGRKAYAYFGETADRVNPPPRSLDLDDDGVQAPTPMESGTSGGRYYAVYTGSSGGKEPPIPPRRPSSGLLALLAGPSGPRLPSTGIAAESFVADYKKAIAEQTQKRPERVTILYRSENGILVRYVNDQPMALFAIPADVQELVKRYSEASLGPEKIFRAQKLADVLLVDIDSQLPDGTREIFIISQNNILKDISLPMLEAMAGRKDATKLNSIDLMTRSYVVNTMNFAVWYDEVDLSVLSKEVKGIEKAEKIRASEEIKQEAAAKNVPLKQLLSKASSKNLNSWVELLTHPTEGEI